MCLRVWTNHCLMRFLHMSLKSKLTYLNLQISHTMTITMTCGQISHSLTLTCGQICHLLTMTCEQISHLLMMIWKHLLTYKMIQIYHGKGVDFSDQPTSNHSQDNASRPSHEFKSQQVISELPSTLDVAEVLSEKDMNVQGPYSLTACNGIIQKLDNKFKLNKLYSE